MSPQSPNPGGEEEAALDFVERMAALQIRPDVASRLEALAAWHDDKLSGSEEKERLWHEQAAADLRRAKETIETLRDVLADTDLSSVRRGKKMEEALRMLEEKLRSFAVKLGKNSTMVCWLCGGTWPNIIGGHLARPHEEDHSKDCLLARAALSSPSLRVGDDEKN